MVKFEGLKKKTVIIATSAVLGASLIGGVSYKVVEANYQENLEEANIAIHTEQGILDDLAVQVGDFQTKEGYLRKDLEQETVDNAKETLNKVEADASTYNVKESDIEDEITVIKTVKEDVASELKIVEEKLALQSDLNELFTKKAINGNEIKKHALKKEVTNEELDSLASSLEDSETFEDGAWVDSVNSLVEEGNTQLKHISNASNKVSGLFDKKDNEKVNKKVKRDSLEEAEEAVAKVKNEEVKEDFEGKLGKVETFIAQREEEKKLAEEEEARKLAEAEEAKRAEEQAQAEAEQVEVAQTEGTVESNDGSGTVGEGSQSTNNESASNGGSQSSSSSTGSSNGGSQSSNSGSNGTASNNNGSSNSESSNSSSSNSSSSSSSNGSSSSSSSGSSKSSGSSNSGNSGISNSGNSGNSSSGGSSNSGSTDKGSSSSGGNWSNDVNKTDGGKVGDWDSDKGEAGNTWESQEGTGGLDDFCKDFGC